MLIHDSARSQHLSPQKLHPKKQYSYQEMRKWCEDLLQVRTAQLMREINENNEVIKVLSEKVKLLQSDSSRRQRQHITPDRKRIHPQVSRDQIIHIANSLLNSKLKDIQEDVQRKLSSLESNKNQMIKALSKKEIQGYQIRMQDQITSKINNIKVFVKDRLQHTQKGNSEYWGKMKHWLKGLQQKFNACVGESGQMQRGMDQIDQMVSRSLLNVFKLRNFNTRVKEVEASVYDLEEAFKNITEYQNQYRLLMENKRQDFEDYSALQTRLKPNAPSIDTDSIIQQNDIQAYGSFPDKLSPLQHNFSERDDSLGIPSPSFYSNTTARRPGVIGDTQNRVFLMSKSKGIQLPMSCYRDQFGYLKNSLNNYIFDLQGNMFKPSPEEFNHMLGQNILRPL